MHRRAFRVPEAAVGVEVAVRRTYQEIRRLIWQTVLVASGLWTAATACAAAFAAGLADALEAGAARASDADAARWNRGMIGNVRSRLGRATRRCEPVVRGWQRQAARIDRQILDRRLAGDDAGRRAVTPIVAPSEDRSSNGS